MKLLDRLKGKLLSAFASPATDKAPPMPKHVLMRVGYISSHVVITEDPTTEPHICKRKWRWKIVAETMRSTLDPSAMNREHRAFIGHFNVLHIEMRISDRGMFEVPTESLMELYNRRHVFDEIARILSSRVTDLSNVTRFPGAAIPSDQSDAKMILRFKEKFVSMTEATLRPYLDPADRKEPPQIAQDRQETVQWERPGRRPF